MLPDEFPAPVDDHVDGTGIQAPGIFLLFRHIICKIDAYLHLRQDPDQLFPHFLDLLSQNPGVLGCGEFQAAVDRALMMSATASAWVRSMR